MAIDELSEVQLGLLCWSLVALGISPGEAWMDAACGASERMLCRAEELRNQPTSSRLNDGTGTSFASLGPHGNSGRQGVVAGGPGTLSHYPKQVLWGEL